MAMLLPMFGSPATAQDETGSVDVEIFVCPESADPFDSLDDLTNQCTESADAVGILVSNGSGYFQLTGAVAASEQPQRVHVDGVPAGDIVITPQLPTGYDISNVYCREGDGPIEAVILNLDDGAPWNLQADVPLTCQVIVFPIVEEGTPVASPVPASSSLTVFVHGCPVGFGGTSATDLVEACAGHPVSGLYVSDLPDYYASATTSGIAGENSVTFAEMQGTDFSLIYMYPRSLTTLAVLCDAGSGSDDPSTWRAGAIISGMSIQLPVDPGAHVTCHWFNDAGDVEGDTPGNTLEVKAWNCPADFEAEGESWSGYLRACEEPSLDTSFTLTAGAELPSTVSNDWYLWQGLPAGNVTLDATMPDGFGEPVIFCATTTGDVTRIERPIAPNGPLAMTFEQEDAHIRNCDWFNFPVAGSEASPVASENGSLEVTVYTCPAFTFVGPDECVIDDSGVEFSLLQWNGDPAVWAWEVTSLVAVGGDGIITFDDLEAADYWPLANDAAWCHVESDALDVSGRWIDVEPGTVTTVNLYSCIAPDV
jgi:hypothetical protein